MLLKVDNYFPSWWEQSMGEWAFSVATNDILAWHYQSWFATGHQLDSILHTDQGRRHKNLSPGESNEKWSVVWGSQCKVWEGRHHRLMLKSYKNWGCQRGCLATLGMPGSPGTGTPGGDTPDRNYSHSRVASVAVDEPEQERARTEEAGSAAAGAGPEPPLGGGWGSNACVSVFYVLFCDFFFHSLVVMQHDLTWPI